MTCPVPKDQQPLNEYVELKEAFFYRWAKLERSQYLRAVLLMWLGFTVVFSPVAMSIESPSRHLWEFIGVASIGGALGLVLPMLLMLSGWSHVRQRLDSAKIFYEESGWYDGQTWEKPEADLAKDRLLVTYEIKPVLNRLYKTLLGIVVFLAIIFGALQIT
ncbi:CGLD27 family protein [Pseudanabaena sp. FACHB-1998]|uniref:CGLD27 family protein n=1 Tax=Pseudanabaena sp. FACHB-1998 TaxID=2692858 RepID=UPI0016801940|nr:CGLD27 family protein [Pseudanabaena sp. FACHB-1998]MBD2175468.1 CGLD27 family protein [Pseudanabaena sp. FACHB-1998]